MLSTQNAILLPHIEFFESLTREISGSPWSTGIREIPDIVNFDHYKHLRIFTLCGSGDRCLPILGNICGYAVQLRRLNLIGPWCLEDENIGFN
jgi:hypothetical protein